MANERDLPEAQDEGVWYRFLCPVCDMMNESEDDTRNSVVTCDDCGAEVYHNG